MSEAFAAEWGPRIQMMSVQIVPLIAAIVLHEFAHGWVAHKWGDDTAKEHGRLTLNPWPHMDILGTLLFPLICLLSGAGVLFGWAKPVPIDPRRFRRFRPALFWVSSAGVLMNFSLAILSAALFCAMWAWMPRDEIFFKPLSSMALMGVSANFALGIFNLIPFPPLDGSKIVESALPLRWIPKFERLAAYGGKALLLLFMMSLFSGGSFSPFAFLGVPITVLTEGAITVFARLFGLQIQ